MVSILGQEGIWLSLKSLKLTTRIPLKWCCASHEGASTLSTNRTRELYIWIQNSDITVQIGATTETHTCKAIASKMV